MPKEPTADSSANDTQTGTAKARSGKSRAPKSGAATSRPKSTGKTTAKKSAPQSSTKSSGDQNLGDMIESFDGVTIGKKKYGRTAVVVALVLIGVLATPIGLAAKWAFNTITHEDSYVSLVSDMAQETSIQQAVSTEVTTLVMDRIDLQGHVAANDGWLGKLNDLVGAVTGNDAVTQLETKIQPVLESGVNAFVGSNKFQNVWSTANREAHGAVLAALEDTTTDVNGLTASGDVTIDLSSVVGDLGSDSRVLQLVGSQISSSAVEIPLLKAEQVDSLRPAYSLASSVSVWAPIVGILALIAALVLAKKRVLVGLLIGVAFLLSAFLPFIVDLYVAAAAPAALAGDGLSAQVARHLVDEAVAQSSSGLGYCIPVGIAIIVLTCGIWAVTKILSSRKSVAV